MKTIEVKDILSISGKGGLFKLVAQARNGIVVESFEDQKRHVAPATARVSSMEDIAIFTEEEDMPLGDVFYKIHQKQDGGETISHKSGNDELKSYFLEILPDYDEDRVYVSDIKKILSWYNILHKHEMLTIIEKEEEGSEEKDDEVSEEKNDKVSDKKVDKTPEKKASDKKASEKKASDKKASDKKASDKEDKNEK